MPLLWTKIWSFIKNLLEKARDLLGKQRKLILMGAGVLAMLLAALIIIPFAVRQVHDNAKVPSNSSRKSENTLAPLSIHQEEFFLPDEPDFLPEVLLEQEPRTRWTPEDIRPFWRDLTQEDPEKWRERIETVIDELLKGVP